MDGMLSQEEINALLGSMEAEANSEEDTTTDSAETSTAVSDSEMLTPEETDALGEIANISMGTAATTLSILVNNLRMLQLLMQIQCHLRINWIEN